MEKAAIYCRLSKEDQDKINQGDESASIGNQKLLLFDYAVAHQFAIYDIYSDDDYSGLDSERPDFKRLLKDAKSGCFQTIICKTQSRFTRDMELVEKYIHGLFPIIGVRFIGVVDHVDTDIKGNKKARQINGLINEWYCEDLSENIKSVFRTKMEKGQFLGSYAPYGYQKDPRDKHRLIIDEEAALVVRKIFDYAVNGLGVREITYKLYEERIPTPCAYKKYKGLNYKHSLKEGPYRELGLWGSSTIKKMLSNRVYIGDMVQGRERKVSYKSKKVIKTPESEWVIVPDCHEPIVAKETFALVQDLRKSRRYSHKETKDSGREISLLAGKVKCKDCGSTLTRNNGANLKYTYLYCQLNRRTRKEQCSPHSIKYIDLLELLEEKIHSLIHSNMKANPANEFITLEDDNKKVLSIKRADLKKVNQQLDKIKKALTMLYVDKTGGIITEEEYLNLKESLNEEAKACEKEREELQFYLEELTKRERAQGKKEDLIRKYANFDSIDHTIINEFVDYVEVGEKDKENNQEVIIHWRF